MKKSITHKIMVSNIINYLNEKTGKQFRATTKGTLKCISARINDGYTMHDFIRVIDLKVAEWSQDKKMAPYLRPETLFGNKFEGYLNSETKDTNSNALKMRNAC